MHTYFSFVSRSPLCWRAGTHLVSDRNGELEPTYLAGSRKTARNCRIPYTHTQRLTQQPHVHENSCKHQNTHIHLYTYICFTGEHNPTLLPNRAHVHSQTYIRLTGEHKPTLLPTTDTRRWRAKAHLGNAYKPTLKHTDTGTHTHRNTNTHTHTNLSQHSLNYWRAQSHLIADHTLLASKSPPC